ncbi:unnamed protein product [Phaedon cochleariae]|uniref:Dynein axonemal assembly factor 1 homolog n=1 Tax=Phaedon cochleariae TaxID=80249 RepID=A0A9P0GN74_PHACE|nr:unnamed protein product [Phaedon cochleariae]
MAVTDPCKAREPRVIDNALIEKCLEHQFPKGEIGRLMRKDGIPMDELQEIRMEFMNILKIDHLWVMKSLTKLQLNNNFIENIENLDTLVHLRELDLSFNKINKIANLDKLVNLEKLSFYSNLIVKIENMDTLKKLMIFSIGRNEIEDPENVYYLRRFKMLTSLNMAHNPCARDNNFRIFIAAFLPKVVYYEYKRIEESERDEGTNMFLNKLRAIELVEELEDAKTANIEKAKADAELHSVSFVEYLNSRYLFDLLFEDDEEGKALMEMGDEVQEFYVEYEEQFIDLCKQIFDVGQKHYKIRSDEMDNFTKTVEQAKKENQEESIGHMENFMEKKNDMFSLIRLLQKHLDNDIIDVAKYTQKIEEFNEIHNELIHDTWKKLMKLELQLFEQVEEVNQNFEHTMTDMINAFIEEAQALFTQMRALEVTYTENLADIGARYITQANLGESFFIPEVLRPIMADKEFLNNAIASTHDMHLQIIDNREDTLVGRAKQWLESFCTGLTKDEIKRNRYKLLEINHFLDIQREEFDECSDYQLGIDPEEDDHFMQLP